MATKCSPSISVRTIFTNDLRRRFAIDPRRKGTERQSTIATRQSAEPYGVGAGGSLGKGRASRSHKVSRQKQPRGPLFFPSHLHPEQPLKHLRLQFRDDRKRPEQIQDGRMMLENP